MVSNKFIIFEENKIEKEKPSFVNFKKALSDS